jgi:hypothetical protein
MRIRILGNPDPKTENMPTYLTVLSCNLPPISGLLQRALIEISCWMEFSTVSGANPRQAPPF